MAPTCKDCGARAEWFADIDTTLGGRDQRAVCDSCAEVYREMLATHFLAAKGAVVPIDDALRERYPSLDC